MKQLAGADKLKEWFGYWPDFHDAEITELFLSRSQNSYLKVKCFRMTDEVNSVGCFEQDKKVEVVFEMSGLSDLNLQGFNQQNVIGGLEVERAAHSICLNIIPCYGLSGSIHADDISIRLAFPEITE